MTDLVVIQRLLLTALLSGTIGYERERHGRAAGFRTHILVGVGSCLVMLTGFHLMEILEGVATFDPTRMGAQVVSGIGFLGAGTILRFRASVRGLTTAASLWAAGGIGLASGAGFISGVLVSWLIIIVLLFGFSRMERGMRRDWYRTLVVETEISSQELGRIRKILAEYDVEIRDLNLKTLDDPAKSRLEIHAKLLSERYQKDILHRLMEDTKRKAFWRG